MSDVRVSSWLDLQEAVFEDAWQPSLARFRSRFVYRGGSSSTHALTSSLQTGGFEKHERHLLSSFRKYATRSDVPGDLVWHWLALAKHHGLPTRLLDWTYSPYVAMHFATVDLSRFHEDGSIWCVDYRKTNELLPAALRGLISSEDVNLFTTELLSRAATTLEQFDALADQDFVAFLEPPSLDDRIVNQFALFSLPSSARMSLQDLLQSRPGLYRRIIIPAELKWEVRDKLDQANITERVLFPGLDGLSSWLKRYFTSREGT